MSTPMTMPRQRTLTVQAPANDFITEIARLERRVASSAERLDRAAKAHHRDLTRLAVLRDRVGLSANPVPELAELATAGVPDGWFVGRIFDRAPLTTDSKTEGSIALAAGLAIRWTASSFLADSLEPLFNGLPVMVFGPVKDRVMSISTIKPAPLAYWHDDELPHYETALRHDAAHLQKVTEVRKALMGQLHQTCQHCGGTITKAARASLIEQGDDFRLVCRPCKQEWIDAGRPELIVGSPAKPGETPNKQGTPSPGPSSGQSSKPRS